MQRQTSFVSSMPVSLSTPSCANKARPELVMKSWADKTKRVSTGRTRFSSSTAYDTSDDSGDCRLHLNWPPWPAPLVRRCNVSALIYFISRRNRPGPKGSFLRRAPHSPSHGAKCCHENGIQEAGGEGEEPPASLYSVFGSEGNQQCLI